MPPSHDNHELAFQRACEDLTGLFDFQFDSLRDDQLCSQPVSPGPLPFYLQLASGRQETALGIILIARVGREACPTPTTDRPDPQQVAGQQVGGPA